MKIIYLGTPDFAVAPLESLINSHHQVLAVVTQPDKSVGRGGKIQCPPTKIVAKNHNIPVFQFSNINKQGVEELKKLNADVMVTCAYGQILRKQILELTPHGVINIHGSVLPKYRGASPVQCALINGETKTGITILKSGLGIDDGDVLLTAETDIEPVHTSVTLLNKLSLIGAEKIVQALDLIEQNKAVFTPQDNSQATYFKIFEKSDGKINFNKTSIELVNFLRGINPWPGAYFDYQNQNIKVFEVKPASEEKLNSIIPDWQQKQNGEILIASAKHGLIVKCENGAISIETLQAPNAKQMPAKSYLNGKKLEVGTILN